MKIWSKAVSCHTITTADSLHGLAYLVVDVDAAGALVRRRYLAAAVVMGKPWKDDGAPLMEGRGRSLRLPARPTTPEAAAEARGEATTN